MTKQASLDALPKRLRGQQGGAGAGAPEPFACTQHHSARLGEVSPTVGAAGSEGTPVGGEPEACIAVSLSPLETAVPQVSAFL